jgi:hypothetical protein
LQLSKTDAGGKGNPSLHARCFEDMIVFSKHIGKHIEEVDLGQVHTDTHDANHPGSLPSPGAFWRMLRLANHSALYRKVYFFLYKSFTRRVSGTSSGSNSELLLLLLPPPDPLRS